MRKPVFCISLWPLCSDIIFFIDHYCAGVSNKHCLLPFFHLFFTYSRPRYQVSVYRTIGPLVLTCVRRVHKQLYQLELCLFVWVEALRLNNFSIYREGFHG